MATSAFALCLWPGLPQLWRSGDGRGLAAAVAFAGLLNTALVASFVWPAWLPAPWQAAVWALVAVAQIGGVWSGWRSLRAASAAKNIAAAEDLFAAAQREYLKGNWYEAEAILARLLAADPQDAEARLQLATLCRHTRRLDEARQHLRALERLEAADRWRLEIRGERERLSRLEANGAEEGERPHDEGAVTNGAPANPRDRRNIMQGPPPGAAAA
jgi:tetratricopeptide (TPR) repeat protein